MPRIKAKVYHLIRKFGQTFRKTGPHTNVHEKRKLSPEADAELAKYNSAAGPASKLFAERRKADKPVSEDRRRH